MTRRTVRWWRLLLAVILVSGALAMAGVAWGQSSGGVDFGCWGATVATGGLQSSATNRIVSTVGQPGAGESLSPGTRIRAGYIQRWNVSVDTPPLQLGEYNRFLPFIAGISRAVRPCSW